MPSYYAKRNRSASSNAEPVNELLMVAIYLFLSLFLPLHASLFFYFVFSCIFLCEFFQFFSHIFLVKNKNVYGARIRKRNFSHFYDRDR